MSQNSNEPLASKPCLDCEAEKHANGHLKILVELRDREIKALKIERDGLQSIIALLEMSEGADVYSNPSTLNHPESTEAKCPVCLGIDGKHFWRHKGATPASEGSNND